MFAGLFFFGMVVGNVAASGQNVAGTPSFAGQPVGLSSSLGIAGGAAGESITVWAFPIGFAFSGQCSDAWKPLGSALAVTGAGAATPSVFGLPVANAFVAGQTLNVGLVSPLVAGQTLCLEETANGKTPTWSNSILVSNPNDFGRFGTYFTLGLQVTNQQNSSGTASAGQYLELGFNNTFVRAKDGMDQYCGGVGGGLGVGKCKWTPGLAANLDIELSPIPTSGSSASGTLSGGTLSASSISPNQLSSQQSILGALTVSMPMKTKCWNGCTDYFTVAPVARAGFGTLFNSTSTTTSGSSSTTTTFAPGYQFWGLGARFAWDKYAGGYNEAPQMIWQMIITLGPDSNLPSYVCKQVTGQAKDPYAASATPTIVTACAPPNYPDTASTSSGSTPVTTYSYYTDFKTSRPRLNVDAIAKIPGYPFVLGVKANLNQYAIFSKPNLDYLSKPGNDVRIYVGISVNVATFISKL
jgi:hypothetical protein